MKKALSLFFIVTVVLSAFSYSSTMYKWEPLETEASATTPRKEKTTTDSAQIETRGQKTEIKKDPGN